MEPQYTNTVSIPYVDDTTVWTKDHDFYWPDPTKVAIWNGSEYVKSEDTAIADLPDMFHWNSEYVENNPVVFESV